MKDTLIPLSIAWFDAEGRFVSATDMAPCGDEPAAPPTAPAPPYRYALEVPQGELPRLAIGPGTRLVARRASAARPDGRASVRWRRQFAVVPPSRSSSVAPPGQMWAWTGTMVVFTHTLPREQSAGPCASPRQVRREAVRNATVRGHDHSRPRAWMTKSSGPRSTEPPSSSGPGAAHPGRVDRWGRRRLAYEIAHKREGYYVLRQASAEPAVMSELDRTLHLADGVLRHKVIRQPATAPPASPPGPPSDRRPRTGGRRRASLAAETAATANPHRHERSVKRDVQRKQRHPCRQHHPRP